MPRALRVAGVLLCVSGKQKLYEIDKLYQSS
jgi:hypothetical protein